jgi:tRNA(Ile)-lysidine synthase
MMKKDASFPTQLARAYARLDITGKSVLLAVSGGADSMALLHATSRLEGRGPARVEVATLDHGLREESAAEVEAVQYACAALGLPCFSEKLSLSRGAGLEERARGLRYEALEKRRAERGLDFIATAHTANDQAETLLMRLARGASTRGLSSIHERQGRLVRPMLDFTRSEVEGFLSSLGYKSAADPMNEDEQFFRVRVRRQVLPRLEEATGPGLYRRMARAARLFAEDEGLLSARAKEALARVRLSSNALDRASVCALEKPILRRVLTLFFEEAGLPVDLDGLEEAQRALEERRVATLKKDWLLRVRNGQVQLAPTPPRKNSGLLSPKPGKRAASRAVKGSQT